jgi:hypothetical protein
LLLESSSANPINGPNSIEKNLSAGDVWSNDIVSKINIGISKKKERNRKSYESYLVVRLVLAKSEFLKYLGSPFIASILNNIKEYPLDKATVYATARLKLALLHRTPVLFAPGPRLPHNCRPNHLNLSPPPPHLFPNPRHIVD